MGYTPGVKAPVIPDVVDEVDAGDVVEGVGIDSWRRVCRVWWVGGRIIGRSFLSQFTILLSMRTIG